MRTQSSEKREMILKCIRDYYEESGCSPSIAEIEARTGISRPTVHRYLVRMREDGLIEFNGHRNIRLSQENRSTTTVPLVGSIACGLPILAEENIEDTFRLPTALLGKGRFFLLRAVGDSMNDAGIEDGDLVVIRQQETAEVGQIVVAEIENEATLKRYYPEENHVRLKAENPAYKDILTKVCRIQGIAVKVMKDLE